MLIPKILSVDIEKMTLWTPAKLFQSLHKPNDNVVLEIEWSENDEKVKKFLRLGIKIGIKVQESHDKVSK